MEPWFLGWEILDQLQEVGLTNITRDHDKYNMKALKYYCFSNDAMEKQKKGPTKYYFLKSIIVSSNQMLKWSLLNLRQGYY